MTRLAALVPLALLSLAAPASASNAQVGVEAPSTLTIEAAKNFTRNQIDRGSAVGSCRRVSQRTVRCAVYSEHSRQVATVKIRDGQFSISIG